MIKAIIFDAGHTLIKIDYKKIVEVESKFLEKENVDINEFVRWFTIFYKLCSGGLIHEKELFNLLSLKLGIKSFPKNFTKKVLDTNTFEESTKKLLLDLKKNYKLGLLANNVKEWVYYDLRRFDIEKIFDAIVVSSEVGYRKPDARAYAEILKRLVVKGEKCVFVSDELNEDLAGAKAMDMKTVWLKVKNEEMSFKPDFIIKDLEELRGIMNQLK